MAKIVVVEDDPGWAELYLELLKRHGFEVVHFPTPGRFFDSLARVRPDLVVLDMQLPGMHGRDVIRVLRANEATKNIVIVAVSGHEVGTEHTVRAFEFGADEYLAKPVNEDLLIARINTLLRRHGAGNGSAAEASIQIGALRIIPDEHVVTVDDKQIKLTRLEYELLMSFARQTNRVLTRGFILETIWKGTADVSTRTVDRHVESLRQKLGPFGKRIETIIRVGYVFRE